MIRRSFIVLMAAALTLAAQASAQSEPQENLAPHPLTSRTGVIQALDFAGNSVVIGGIEYGVAIDANVEIGGTFGAFTMLKKGMKVYYEYLVISPTIRRIVRIQELPAGADPGVV